MLLAVDRVNVSIGASRILTDVSLAVAEREVVCLVGRNGAGKTTTLRTIMGFLGPSSGKVSFRQRDLAGLAPHQIAQMGICFAPEDSGIFGDLTTRENIEMATWTRESGRTAGDRIALAYSVFPALEQYQTRKGNQLSGGERKMLSIARALAMDPTMLLLDEPFEGLSPGIILHISESLQAITRMGVSILMAESNLYHVPEFTDRLYVVERGEIIFAGRPRDVSQDEATLRVLGGIP